MTLEYAERFIKQLDQELKKAQKRKKELINDYDLRINRTRKKILNIQEVYNSIETTTSQTEQNF